MSTPPKTKPAKALDINANRLWGATIKLGATSSELVISCKTLSWMFEPSVETIGDTLKVACGDTILPAEQTNWVLKWGGLQDFDDAQSLQEWSLEHEGTEQDAEITWNKTGTVTKARVKVRALPLGGNAAEVLRFEAEWPCIGHPTTTRKPATA